MQLVFAKEIYPKIVLLKSAYSFVDMAYVHLDADEKNWIVTVELKNGSDYLAFSEKDFVNEMLIQNLRHEVYKQTKNIREMLFARSVASSLVINDADSIDSATLSDSVAENDGISSEKDILHDWFEKQ